MYVLGAYLSLALFLIENPIRCLFLAFRVVCRRSPSRCIMQLQIEIPRWSIYSSAEVPLSMSWTRSGTVCQSTRTGRNMVLSFDSFIASPTFVFVCGACTTVLNYSVIVYHQMFWRLACIITIMLCISHVRRHDGFTITHICIQQGAGMGLGMQYCAPSWLLCCLKSHHITQNCLIKWYHIPQDVLGSTSWGFDMMKCDQIFQFLIYSLHIWLHLSNAHHCISCWTDACQENLWFLQMKTSQSCCLHYESFIHIERI